MNTSARASIFTPVLVAGCAIIVISFAVRASFGVFQIPIAEEFGWLRSEFSLAIAIQNLAWGIGQPLFGAFAEKLGDRMAIFLGALIYAAGLVLSSFAVTPEAHQMLEILVGFGVAGTGFGVILAVVGRASSDENRSMSLAIATAAGSAGQVFGAPLAEWLLGIVSWQTVFLIFAAAILASLSFLPLMKSPPASKAQLEESMGTILRRAFRDPSYTLIFLGFFSCGYQLAFVTAHFPAFVTEMCGPIVPGGMLDSLGISTTSALGRCNFVDRGGQYCRHANRRLAGQALFQEILAGWHLHGPHHCGGGLYSISHYACHRADFLGDDGGAVAGHRAPDQRSDRAYLWAALHGHAVWHCVFVAPNGQFFGRMAGGAHV